MRKISRKVQFIILKFTFEYIFKFLEILKQNKTDSQIKKQSFHISTPKGKTKQINKQHFIKLKTKNFKIKKYMVLNF